jgi:hypothetical protein
MNDSLDDLLSASLEGVEDGGFSRHVLAKITAVERRQDILELCATVVALAIVLALVPFGGLVRPVETLALDLSFSLPVAMACAMLVFSQSLTRMLED